MIPGFLRAANSLWSCASRRLSAFGQVVLSASQLSAHPSYFPFFNKKNFLIFFSPKFCRWITNPRIK